MTGPTGIWTVVPIGQRLDGTAVDTVLRAADEGRGVQARLKRAIEHGRVERFRGVDADREVNEAFYCRGWTDGLPIVAPTVGRVQEMQRYSTLSPADALGEMDPLMGLVTAEKVAANAVMAGCLPEYFPVLLAALRGIMEPAFNLRGVQTTDENVTPLLVVSGAIVERLALNAGLGALGPGRRANATIGRALRLVMTNVGGGWPGVVSLAGIGQAARYTLCVGERRQPGWALLHEEAGLSPESSAVTIMRAETAINVTGGLDDIASVMASAASALGMLHGGSVAVLLAPHTAAACERRGWTKRDVARYLFEYARLSTAAWRKTWVASEIAPTYGLPAWVQAGERHDSIPIVPSADRIVVFVAGGDAPIAQHVYFPTWGFPDCRITRAIDLPSHFPTLENS